MEALGAGTWHWDRRSRAVDWDPTMEALYGLPEGGFGGRFEDWVACIHPEDRTTVLDDLEETLETGGPHLVVYRTVLTDGSVRWIEGRGRVLRDSTGGITGMVGACRDVTDLQEAEQERGRMLTAERRARERLEFLAEASDLLARSLDVDETLHELAELAVPRLGDWCAIDLLEHRRLRLSALAHSEPAKVALAQELRARYGSVMRMRRGAALPGDGFIPEITDDLLRGLAHDDEHLRALRELELGSAVVVPLQARGQGLGLLALVHAESGRRHSREDYTLAVELARRASIAVDNARLFSERSHVASVLQHALLPPRLPAIPGVELASHYDTADQTDIGGDFYDAMGAGDDWTLVIGDVRGKGVEAASLASLARHTVRAAALRDPDPGHILGVLNDALVENDPLESFCTAVCAHLRVGPGRATLDLAAGGHPPPLLLRPGGELVTVEGSGPLIGLLPDCEYPVQRLTLRPEDLLFFYTDGLTEARRGDELFGLERLQDAVRATAGLTADAAIKHVHTVVEDFQAQQRDDVALLALRLLPD